MNHARTNDPLPFLPCFTRKDGELNKFVSSNCILQKEEVLAYNVQNSFVIRP